MAYTSGNSGFDLTKEMLKPDSYEIEIRKVNTLFARQEYGQALKLTRRLLKKYPNHSYLYNTLGEIYLRSNQVNPAIRSFKEALKLDANYPEVYFNLGSAFVLKGRIDEASKNFQQVVRLVPGSADAHFNLGLLAQQSDQLQSALGFYQKTVEISQDIPEAHNNTGVILNKLNNPSGAVKAYKKAISLRPDSAEFHNNIGLAYVKLGELGLAKKGFESAIRNNPKIAEIFNNYGNALLENGEINAARDSFLRAIQIDSSFIDALWNLSGTVTTIDEHISLLEDCLQIDQGYKKAKLMLSSMKAYLGDPGELNTLLETSLCNHPYIRSTCWLIDLKRRPAVYFNRWQFYDSVSKLSQPSRPFYEFGVWRGSSFRYLIKIYKQGYGFDTFQGIPEDWDDLEKGSYSSDGAIPSVEGGTFIAGEFDKTLPTFFSKERPKASLINIDSDLYSSAKSVLVHARRIIDEFTVIVFDQFLMNEHWENDEKRALEEFCAEENMGYEVIAVSLFTKQVAVKLSKLAVRQDSA